MIILGVDPGSVRTGFGAIDTDGRRHHLLEQGTLAPPGRCSLPERLFFIHSGITRLIERLQPDALAVEDVFHAVNTRTALVLGHVRGVILLAGAQAHLPVHEFPPATVKLQITGFGRAEKSQVALMVYRLLALPQAGPAGDASDALAVALCHAHLHHARIPRLLIAQLQGRILRKGPQEVIVDVNGVGYRVLIPVSTFYRLPDEGAIALLRIHTHVREDTLALFGFLTAAEHDLFEKLIGVAGVGPKLAVNVLSGMEAGDLMDALRASDVARLTRIPGVGKKTAERLVLELKDKMPAHSAPIDATGPAAASSRDDLLSALVHLGYSRAEAERGVERALRDDETGRFEDLLRRSLRALASR